VTEARAAYDRGAKAYDAEEYTTAAAELARADLLAPNAMVLELALKSVLKAGDPVLGMSLVERVEQRGLQGGALEQAMQARARFASRVGRVIVTCRGACAATVDGVPISLGSPRWMSVGAHDVEISANGLRERRRVDVLGGALARVEQAPPNASRLPPSAPPVPASSSDGRVSPALFWVGLGATALLGVASAFSGADLGSRHEQFVQSPSEQGAQDGRAAQIRTNVLIGVTIATGALTGALGLFAVRWKS
jgi:hypothetical protein